MQIDGMEKIQVKPSHAAGAMRTIQGMEMADHESHATTIKRLTKCDGLFLTILTSW